MIWKTFFGIITVMILPFTYCCIRCTSLEIRKLYSPNKRLVLYLDIGKKELFHNNILSAYDDDNTVRICAPAVTFNSNDQIDNIKDLMLSSIKWYKSALSPLMPPNCRFLPTCSSYAMEAIESFGSFKGLILIAWRIFRCNPTGGSGYDPPVWPPPHYLTGSTTKK